MLLVTYLAFIRPYSDKIHKHPHRPEVVIPIRGEARHTTFDNKGKILESRILKGENQVAVSTQMSAWHALEVVSEFLLWSKSELGHF